MSTSVIEPGARLAGRYRLETRVSEAAGSTVWKAIDETLARAVTVRTFAPGFPRVHEVIMAARAASRLTDPRLAQVFDAEDNAEQAYVVSEWIVGESLEELLVAGPMEPPRAAGLILEAAEALAAAHGAGLAHLGLTPRVLIWTSGGTVKITGLGVTAALSMIGADQPAVADTRGLGRLLYAALTSHWPGPEETRLPPAPMRGDAPTPPRQLRPDLPAEIDEIARRALPSGPVPPGEAFTSPAQLVAALRTVPRTPPNFLPVTPARSGPRDPGRQPRAALTATAVQPPAPTDGGSTRPAMPAAGRAAPTGAPPGHGLPGGDGRAEPSTPQRSRSGPRPALVGLATAIVAAVLVVGGWALMRDDSGDAGKTATPPNAEPSKPQRSALAVARATGFDPRGDGGEHSDEAKFAIDGKPGTVWTTEGYESAELGALKQGVGLLLDMGDTVQINAVKVSVPGEPGSRVELRVGDDEALRALRKVAGPDESAGGDLEFQLGEPAAGRYVLLWFTKLAPGGDGGKFRGQVGDVVVFGSK